MLSETSERQAPEATRILRSNGLRAQLDSSEELDSTIVIGTRPGGG
jgi:release factor glutamine methyltransferase